MQTYLPCGAKEATRRFTFKKVFLEITKNYQENISVRVFFIFNHLVSGGNKKLGILKKIPTRLIHKCFLVNFAKEHLSLLKEHLRWLHLNTICTSAIFFKHYREKSDRDFFKFLMVLDKVGSYLLHGYNPNGKKLMVNRATAKSTRFKKKVCKNTKPPPPPKKKKLTGVINVFSLSLPKTEKISKKN